MRTAKGILLYSGGLDSLLAGKILLNQNVTLVGLHCILPFHAPDLNTAELPAVRLASQIGLVLEFYHCDAEYMSMLKNPHHGYGKNINPCIDCKLFFLKKAAERMYEQNADFVATGEVVGQRPMSQMKHMMRHLEKEAGLEGRLLRPLSAKILPPTIPEQEGLIDREKLLGMSGRGRKAQMTLAAEFNIAEYASPAGGCLFTDPNYARRAMDIITRQKKSIPVHLYILTLGRYFRLHEHAAVIVARNEHENNELEKYSHCLGYLFIPNFKGPTAATIGAIDKKDMNVICAIIAKYGSPNNKENVIVIKADNLTIADIRVEEPIAQTMLESMRV